MNRLDALCDISVKSFISMSYRYSTKPTANEHIRKNDLGLIFVAEGQTTITSGGKTINLNVGDGVFVPLNQRYAYLRTKPGKVFVLNFSVYDTTLFTDFIQFHIADIKLITPYLDSFKSLFFSAAETKRPALLAIFYNLLQNVLRSGETRHPALKKAINYMENNFGNPLLNCAQFATAAGYSEGHLRRLFKEVHSVTPMQYLNNLRIDHSKNLLLGTNLSIKEISEYCGFSSPFYFSNFFKSKVGYSPTGYREKNIISI